MKGYKSLVALSVLVTAIALSACRREVEHTPMKLGAPAAEEVAR